MSQTHGKAGKLRQLLQLKVETALGKCWSRLKNYQVKN